MCGEIESNYHTLCRATFYSCLSVQVLGRFTNLRISAYTPGVNILRPGIFYVAHLLESFRLMYAGALTT